MRRLEQKTIATACARPLLERRVHRLEGIELAALQPYIATLEADRVADRFGEDDGALGWPQLRTAVENCCPYVALPMGPAERRQARIQPGPAVLEFIPQGHLLSPAKRIPLLLCPLSLDAN